MGIFNKIKKWSIKKKRIFAISIALFLTILVIVLNSVINSLWKDEARKNNFSDKNNPITSIKELFTKIINEAKPILGQVFGSSTQDKSSGTSQIIDQNNSTSSSFSTTSNIVE
jgi:predicted PurR-regulated permease PerM